MIRVVLAVAFLSFTLLQSVVNPVAKLHVPSGFVIEQVAGPPDVVFPMFAAFDDRGRLFVAESSGLDLYAELQKLTRKCRVRLLESPDDQGRFRKATVFADQLVFPMGLVWRGNKLYVADPPDLITLEDTDGDGKADQRTVLLTGFGHKDNGSLHGLVFGPDGWLYLTMGDPDGYKLKRQDGRVIEGSTGALLRCKPDGSDVEVVCTGFTNLVEVAFTPSGRIIGSDNWFQQPTGGIRDALIHLVEGGRYPENHRKPAPVPQLGEPLPALALYPAVAVSGLMRYEGTALPREMQGNLFSAQHNSRKVGRHVLIPNGSTFTAEDHDFVRGDDPDFHPADVLEGADGSIYVVDTGSWYVHHCPTGAIRKTDAKGGIYRVRPEKMPTPDDPWGLKIDWAGPAAKLAHLLADARPAVRDRARQVLVSRGQEATRPLLDILEESSNPNHIREAVWTLAAIPDDAALPGLRKTLGNPVPDVAASAARVLGRRKDIQASADLVRLLTSKSADVRLAAAEALAHCGQREAVTGLFQALASQPDRFLEHALTHALHHVADLADLHKALEDGSPSVQQAAMILLDQPTRPKGALTAEAVIRRVSAPDPGLRQTALRTLERHPEWAASALGLLKGWLAQPKWSDEQRVGLVSLVLAFQNNRQVQDQLAAALANQALLADQHIVLLETMTQSSLAPLPKSWLEALANAVMRPEPAVRKQAIRTIAVLQLSRFDDTLAKLAEQADLPADLRLEALRAVVQRRPQLGPPVFELLLTRLDQNADPLDRLAAAEVLGRAHLSEAQAARFLKAVKDEALISPSVILPLLQRAAGSSAAPAILDYVAAALRTGWKPAQADLDKLLSALPADQRAKGEEVRDLWKKSLAAQQARLVEFEPLLAGGDAGKGRQVFLGKKAACATCHRIGAEGGQIGPDLTKVGAIRAGRDVLESILIPSSTIAQGHDTYVVATKEGRVLTGVIARQTGELVVLRDSSAAEFRLRRDQIETMNRLPTSLMPEGLDRALSRDELRDLLAYLLSLK